jgi:hypothetical protein
MNRSYAAKFPCWNFTQLRAVCGVVIASTLTLEAVMAAKSKQQSGQEEQEPNLANKKRGEKKTKSLNSREWEKTRTTVRKKTTHVSGTL